MRTVALALLAAAVPGDRLGTRKDVEDQLELQRYASDAVMIAAGASRPEANRPPGARSSRQLPAGSSALRFTFASPSFDGDFLGRAQTMYRTRLEGLESEWTPWSADTVREFSNLPFRRLAFQVEARGPGGQAGPPASWSFAIMPPWWLTRWMFAGYAIAGVASLAGVVHGRTRTLGRRAKALAMGGEERLIVDRGHACLTCEPWAA